MLERIAATMMRDAIRDLQPTRSVPAKCSKEDENVDYKAAYEESQQTFAG
jgi:hypothetical protein